MNNSKQETISDIIADIRAQNQGLPEDGYALSPLGCDLLRIADRIEAAYRSFYDKYKEHTNELNRQILVLKHEADEYNASRNHEVSELREENERLRAALRPVLDAYISQDDTSAQVYDSRLDAAVALNAVREAKRIYEGGAK